MKIKIIFLAFLVISIIASNDCCFRSINNGNNVEEDIKSTTRARNSSFNQGDDNVDPYDKKETEKYN